MSDAASTFAVGLATNVALATLLAAVAALCLRRGWASLAHLLCLVGLLKLIAPPLWRLPVCSAPRWYGPPPLTSYEVGSVPLRGAGVSADPAPDTPAPSADALESTNSTNQAAISVPRRGSSPPAASLAPWPATSVVRPSPAPATVTPATPTPHSGAPLTVTLLAVALLVAAAGSAAVAGLALARARRFRRVLRLARPASRQLQADALDLARIFGLSRCPRVLVVPARLSPMLCFLHWRACVVLPESLLRDAPPAQVRTLLAHELAHAVRRDHWVRVLEGIVTCALWWLPTTWWLRRSLRRAEERCCDARVLHALPQQARAYADALLTTLDFLAGTPHAMPPVACGMSAFHDMKTRLKTIMSESRTAPLSKKVRTVLIAGAAALLPLAPGVAQQDTAAEGKVRAELRAAQSELRQLRAEITQLRAQLRRERGQHEEAAARVADLGTASSGVADAGQAADGPALRAVALAAVRRAMAELHDADLGTLGVDPRLAERIAVLQEQGASALADANQMAERAAHDAHTALHDALAQAKNATDQAAAQVDVARATARDAADAVRIAARDAVGAAQAHLLQLAETGPVSETAPERPDTATTGVGQSTRQPEHVADRGSTRDAVMLELRQQVQRLQRQVDDMMRKIERQERRGGTGAAREPGGRAR
ncbi:MAG: M56 family metallopeptidase [Planctomycetota bacterium]